MASKIARGTVESYFPNGGYGFLRADGRESPFHSVEEDEVFFFRADDLADELHRRADHGQLPGRRVEFQPGSPTWSGGNGEGRRKVLNIWDLPFEDEFDVKAFGFDLHISVAGDEVPEAVLERLVEDHVRATWGGYQRGEGSISKKLPIPDGCACDDVPLTVTYVTTESVWRFRIRTLSDWGTDVEVIARRGTLVHKIRMELHEKTTGYTYQMPDGVAYSEGYYYEISRWPVSARSLRARWYWQARIFGTGEFLEDAKTWDLRELESDERADALEKLQVSIAAKNGEWHFRYPRSEVVHFVTAEPKPEPWPELYDVVIPGFWADGTTIAEGLTLDKANAEARRLAEADRTNYVSVCPAGEVLPTENPDAWMHSPCNPDQGLGHGIFVVILDDEEEGRTLVTSLKEEALGMFRRNEGRTNAYILECPVESSAQEVVRAWERYRKSGHGCDVAERCQARRAWQALYCRYEGGR